MWRRKTNTEIRVEKRTGQRRNILLTILASALVLCAASSSAGRKGWSVAGLAVPVPRFVSDAFRGLAIAGLAVGIGFRVRRWGYHKEGVKICQKCNRVKLDDGGIRCDCGGRLFALAEMRWMDGGVTGATQAARAVRLSSPEPKRQAVGLPQLIITTFN